MQILQQGLHHVASFTDNFVTFEPLLFKTNVALNNFTF